METRDPRLLSEEYAEEVGWPEEAISAAVLEHAGRPRNLGPLERPDGQALQTGICGDSIAVQLRLEGEVIDAARFLANGCGFTMACGSMATELASGRHIREARAIDGPRIIHALGGLPREHSHCADLAANALQAALAEARDAGDARRSD